MADATLLSPLVGSRWTGTNELWLDPTGDRAETSPGTLTVYADRVEYEWSHEGKPHHGSLRLTTDGAVLTDTFHAEGGLPCRDVPGSSALIDVEGRWGDGASWAWRVIVAQRPAFGQLPAGLVLQMTNVTPWGERVRAVRLVGARA